MRMCYVALIMVFTLAACNSGERDTGRYLKQGKVGQLSHDIWKLVRSHAQV